MGNRLAGKVAIVTGAARGMGEAEARLFVAEGARVVLCDLLDEAGEKVAAELGDDAMYLHHDVSDEDSWTLVVEATTERFGVPTVLVNNAGIARYQTIDQMPKEMLAHLAANVVGPWLGIKAVFGPMRHADVGSIINVGSTNSFRGAPGASAYATSKHALAGLRRFPRRTACCDRRLPVEGRSPRMDNRDDKFECMRGQEWS